MANSINISVDEYTTPLLVSAKSDDRLEKIIEMMEKDGVRHLPIIDNGKAVGIISDRDVKMVFNLDGADDLQAKDIMTSFPYVVNSGTPLEEVAFEMSRNKIGSVLVKDPDGKVGGIFTVTDALNALLEVLRGEAPTN